MNYDFKNIYIDREVKDNEILDQFLLNKKNLNLKYLTGSEIDKIVSKISFKEGKRTLVFTTHRGKLFKKCPGMVEPYRCCNLWTLNLISNCPIYCSYCFLQFYLNQTATFIFLNIEQALDELLKEIEKNKNRIYRITTGELSDSLALEPEVSISSRLIEFIRKQSNCLLELKSKTKKIEHLLKINKSKKTIFSWSINTPEIIKKEEKGSATLEQRIYSAQAAQAAGYLIGIHFDPIIDYPGGETDYEETVKYIFQNIDNRRIAWISLGTLRFNAGMEREIAKYYPRSKVFYGEIVKAKDGKKRYIKPIRLKLYRNLLNSIKRYGGDEVFIYLCMEMEETWSKVMDYIPKSPAHLDYHFAESLYRRFPEIIKNKPDLIDYLNKEEGSRI